MIRCTKLLTTPAHNGVWYALAPTGCSTACGVSAGSGTPGRVVCSKGYDAACDSKTKPQPTRVRGRVEGEDAE